MKSGQLFKPGVHDLSDLPQGAKLTFDSRRQWMQHGLGRPRAVPPYWVVTEPNFPRFEEEFPFTLPTNARAYRFPKESQAYAAIKRYVEASSRASTYASSKREDARMKYMEMVTNATWASEFQKAIAGRRLQEGISGSGVKPPRSSHVTVRDVVCIQNRPLWDRYAAAKEALRAEYAGAEDGRPRLHLEVQIETELDGLRRMPVLDEVIGETMLYHVTSPDCIEKISSSGFKASFGRNYGTNEAPRYGMLGQGSYFSNELSKGLTYSTCFLCGDYECHCRSVADRRKLPRCALLVRVVLGNPKYYASLARKFFQKRAVEREFRQVPYTDPRFTSVKDGGGGFDSVISHGHRPLSGFTAFSRGTGSGMNEIMSAKDELIYPEFIVTFVLGDDDVAPSLTTIVRTVLGKYRNRRFGLFQKRSAASRRADEALAAAVEAGKQDQEIGDLILYYVGVKSRVGHRSVVESRTEYGEQIRTDGTLFRYLVEEMQRHGYLAAV